MTDVLALAEHANGELRNTTAELLTAASAFGTPATVVIGAPDATAGFADTLASYGTGGTLVAESDGAAKYLTTPEVDVLVGLASERETPVLVLVSATDKEVAGRVAALTGPGLLSNVTTINDNTSVKYSISDGEYVADGVDHGAPPVYTLHPGSVDPEERSGFARITEISSPEIGNNAVEIVSLTPVEGSDCPELTEAKLIISGGCGAASEDGFKGVVESMADVLGVAAGASHATVNAGYYPDQFQVGQTDKIVSPNLCLALSISGAI